MEGGDERGGERLGDGAAGGERVRALVEGHLGLALDQEGDTRRPLARGLELHAGGDVHEVKGGCEAFGKTVGCLPPGRAGRAKRVDHYRRFEEVGDCISEIGSPKCVSMDTQLGELPNKASISEVRVAK